MRAESTEEGGITVQRASIAFPPLPQGANRSPLNSRFEGEIFRKERVANDLALVQVENESQQAIWGRQKLPVGKICLVTYGGGEGDR